MKKCLVTLDNKSIWITTQFVGFHKWPDAPDEVAYLRDYHRHRFGVKVAIVVKHSNRDVEFLTFKRQLENYIDSTFKDKYFEYSCEHIAEMICKFISTVLLHIVLYVNVDEDGENGASVVPTYFDEETSRPLNPYLIDVASSVLTDDNEETNEASE